MRIEMGAVIAMVTVLTFPPWGIAQEDPPTQPPVPLFPRTMQIGCAEQMKVDKTLRERYSEAPIRRGYTSAGTIAQLYSSENGETWSLTMLFPDGSECLIITGEKLKEVPWQAPKPKDKHI